MPNRQPLPLSDPPLIQRGDAVFLDVDGCLLELASTPAEVVVPADLVVTLRALEDALDGAVAVISGHSLIDVDHLLLPWKPAGAGVHGAEMRFPRMRAIRRHASLPAAIASAIRSRFALMSGVLVENKASAVAVHFARCPEQAGECERALKEVVQGVEGLRIQRGRAVVEAVPATANKGGAVRILREHLPFKDRRPVFVGDDRTDEAAFALMRSVNGLGIKVGEGATLARHRLQNPAGVRQWLTESLSVLAAPFVCAR